LCKEDGDINDDGSFLIDERLDDAGYEQKTCPELEQCCKRTDYVPEPPKKVCKDFMTKTPETCGFHNPKGIGGLVNSLQNRTLYAQYAEFSWMMAIMVERPSDDGTTLNYLAGGSLIHPKVVLTTAHTIFSVDPKKLVVRGGEWETKSEKEICEQVDQKVKRVIRHRQFVRNTLKNNIALLVLTEEFELTPFINTICLPPVNMNFDNKRCLASGWGKNKFGKAGVYQAYLKKIELPVVPRDECQTKLRRTKVGPDYKLSDNVLCAGMSNQFAISNIMFIEIFNRW
jgi:hypothetical protein